MDEKEIGFCPRCGRELVRGATPTGKVCFRCPSCGGMVVTLPVLRESLDAKSIAFMAEHLFYRILYKRRDFAPLLGI